MAKKEVTIFMQKNVVTAIMWDRCLLKKNHGLCFFSIFGSLFGKRSPTGNLYSTTTFFAHEANRNSDIILLPHVVIYVCSLFAGTLLNEACSRKCTFNQRDAFRSQPARSDPVSATETTPGEKTDLAGSLCSPCGCAAHDELDGAPKRYTNSHRPSSPLHDSTIVCRDGCHFGVNDGTRLLTLLKSNTRAVGQPFQFQQFSMIG